MNVFTHKLEEVLKFYNVNPNLGLNDDEVKNSVEKYGRNEFTKEKPISLFKRVLNSLKEPMIIMLILAGVIAVGVNIVHELTSGEGDFIECLGIFIAISLSVTITVVMEGKSAKAFEALNKINEDIFVKVLRNGKTILIAQNDVVVGDIIFVETGNKIVADGRLIESTSLQVNESSLTGESMPVEKDENIVLSNEKTTVADRINMLYSGCFVTAGNGKMLVTSVGDTTEFGTIAKELAKNKETNTPLQEKLIVLSKRIAVFGFSAAGLVFIIQIFNFVRTGTATLYNITEAFITSIVLIVASVPEGLPTIVAVSLSINIIKMSKQNALVKKIIASETIGSVNVICSDKTGTLTENKMTVESVYIKGEIITPEKIANKELLNNFSVNSTADISKEDGVVKFLGNPTECALLTASHKSNVDYKVVRERAKITYSFPFSSDTKCMTSIIECDEKKTVYTKGSPEKILAMCNVSESEVKDIERKITEFQNESRRVIAFAHKNIEIEKHKDYDFENERDIIEKNMIYDGFVAITDPLRAEVYDAVKKSQSAGISVKMLTGDNIVTAKAIARELNMLKDDSIAVEAAELENLTDEELTKILDKICVIARSTPTIKMRIVNLLKKAGNVVAVTGDGINDAPAIKNADVGIAMGISGTEVSKEASDIVLLDDSFATIVKAIEWGRGIYENFKRFIQFQLTVNLSSVIVVLASIIIGLKTPFTALQLLWINIIMDGPPAIALGLEPIRDNLMKRLPTKRNASIVTSDMMKKIVFNGLFISIIFMTQSKLNFLNAKINEMSTVLFTLFVLFQLFNSFNSRETGQDSVFKNLFTNKMMLLSLLVAFILQVIITQFGGSFFKTVPLSFNMWIKVICLAFSVIVVSELVKLINRLIFRKV